MGFFGSFHRGNGHGGLQHRHHEVRVYPGDFPAEDVARFLLQGMEKGEGALVIGDSSHELALRLALGEQASRCVFLDAAVEIDGYVVDGRADPAKFKGRLAPAVREARRRGNGRVRAYGEMVALLAQRGQPEVALQVERLWNQLLEDQPVALLCAYPLQVFADLGHTYASPILAEHTGVTTAVPVSDD